MVKRNDQPGGLANSGAWIVLVLIVFAPHLFRTRLPQWQQPTTYAEQLRQRFPGAPEVPLESMTSLLSDEQRPYLQARIREHPVCVEIFTQRLRETASPLDVATLCDWTIQQQAHDDFQADKAAVAAGGNATHALCLHYVEVTQTAEEVLCDPGFPVSHFWMLFMRFEKMYCGRTRCEDPCYPRFAGPGF